MNNSINPRPTRMNHTTKDMPRTDGAPSAGRIQPQSDERSTAMITKPIAAAHRIEPNQSSTGWSSLGASAILRAKNKITTPTSTSPAKTHRHDAYVVASPPINGPTATAIAPAAPTRP